MLDFEDEGGSGIGGYAKTMSDEFIATEMACFREQAKEVDIVITTALIPGRPAPELWMEDMVKSMKAGSVIVDLASESGGNCALTRSGETVVAHGVQVLGPANIATLLPVHASQMYSKNIVTLISEFIDEEGKLALDFENDVVGPSTVTHAGEIRNERVRDAMGSIG